MLNVVRIWILLSTLLVSSGWILSAFHQLNRAGYGIIFALTAIAFVFWQRRTKWRPKKSLRQLFYKFLKRFKRSAPFLFLVLAFISFVGASVYITCNGDSLAYRTPRVLHWLGAEQWHWIRTADYRMNIAGCGFEWLTAPLVLFTGTDRLFFLINWVSYLMLPGLIFSVFTRLQVRPRVAWWWMWWLSAGWCYAMQAGSINNDSFSTIYVLASVDLALRARKSESVGDLWLSMLASALATGTKQTAIPLFLLWLIAAGPSLKLFGRHLVATTAVVVLSLLVSALPNIILNLKYSGTWAGIPPTYQSSTLANPELHSPFWGIVGNLICLPAQNLLPPFFPWADRWNETMRHFLQTPFGVHFASFERFGYLNHSVSEGSAGIGLGICILSYVSLYAALRYRGTADSQKLQSHPIVSLLHFVPWLLLLIYMSKVGTFENARQLAPYYVFFFPILLTTHGQSILTCKKWWRVLGLLIMLTTAIMLALSRGQPLFPAETSITWLQKNYPHSKLVSKLSNSYSFRFSFEKLRYAFKNSIPANEKVIGYATIAGNAEVGLWLPFETRKVERILPTDSLDYIHSLDIHYIMVDERELGLQNETIQQWSTRHKGNLIDQFSFYESPYQLATYLYLVHLNYQPR